MNKINLKFIFIFLLTLYPLSTLLIFIYDFINFARLSEADFNSRYIEYTLSDVSLMLKDSKVIFDTLFYKKNISFFMSGSYNWYKLLLEKFNLKDKSIHFLRCNFLKLGIVDSNQNTIFIYSVDDDCILSLSTTNA